MAIIDCYMFNMYYILISVDFMLEKLDKEIVQNALARVDFLRTLAPQIQIVGEEFIDFKMSLLDIFGHLFQGTLLIMGALKAEEMNEEAES